MPVLVFPSLGVNASAGEAFRLRGNTRIFASPDAQSQQRTQLDDPVWRARIEYRTLNDARRRLLETFFDQLAGAYGVFECGPARLGYARLGTGTGGLVNGGAQTGKALVTDTWSVNNTVVLAKGDFFSIVGADGRKYLFRCKADATTNGSGAVTLSFEPALRVSPADNAAIEVADPVCHMALADDEQNRIPLRRPYFGAAAVDLVEATWSA